ncbi:MAG: hypothetical protein AB1513_05425 [Pseudomonadota bacterium]
MSVNNLKQWYSLRLRFWAEEALYEAGYGCMLLANQPDAVEEQEWL